MKITGFRRRCNNRQRAVRVAGTYVFLNISSLMAERLFNQMGGRVTVDDAHEGYAYIAPAEPERGA